MDNLRFQPGDRARVTTSIRKILVGRIVVIDQWLVDKDRWSVFVTGEINKGEKKLMFRDSSLESLDDAAPRKAKDLGTIIELIDKNASQACNEIWAIQDAAILSLESPDGPRHPERLVPLLQAIGRIVNEVQEWINETANGAGHGYCDPAYKRRLDVTDAREKQEAA